MRGFESVRFDKFFCLAFNLENFDNDKQTPGIFFDKGAIIVGDIPYFLFFNRAAKVRAGNSLAFGFLLDYF